MRYARVAGLMFVLALAVASIGVSTMARSAQDGTPVPDSLASPVPGAEVVILGDINPEDTDEHLVLTRIELEPGAAWDLDHGGYRILYVESGTVSYRLHDGEAVVYRGLEESEGETLLPGVEDWVELKSGDRVLASPDAVHEYANQGDEPAVVLLWGHFTEGFDRRCGGGCQ